MMAGFLYGQDSEEQEQPTPPLVPPLDELKEMRREKLRGVLGSLFLERYMQPFDDWVSDRGFVKEQLFGADDFGKEMWFALVIKDRVEEPIWIKFHLEKTYAKHEHLGFMVDDAQMERHAKRIRESLKASLEQTFIICLDDQEVRKSMIYGTPHLYRLVTKDTKIENIRKEDMIH